MGVIGFFGFLTSAKRAEVVLEAFRLARDPNLALLRFDAQHAEIWENASSLLSGVKLLLGVDPKKSYRDKVAQVDLH